MPVSRDGGKVHLQYSNWYLGTILSLYLLIYTIASPSPALVAATTVEVTLFVVLAIAKHKLAQTKASQASAMVIDEFAAQYAPIGRVRACWSRLRLFITLAACTFITIDFMALTAALNGQDALSRLIYRGVPSSAWLGFHPGGTMELLAGAYVQAGRYRQAEPIYMSIMQLRREIYGERNEMYAAIEADVAAFYLQAGNLEKAEEYARSAVALAQATNIKTGSGHVLDTLGTIKMQENQFAQAESFYQQALAMRERIFGPHSEKVAQSLQHYAKLLIKMNRQQEAQELLQRADEIGITEENLPQSGNLISAIFIFASLILSYFLIGPKGLLTNTISKRLKMRIKNIMERSENIDSIQWELQRIVALCEFQRDTAQAQHYRALLREIAKTGSQ